ncbi:helix-turn-helix transcriptional regulator [Arthrobacter sp. HLT1-21]
MSQEISRDPDTLLTVPQAAEMLQLSPKTLANWASAGTGPRRVKLTARDIRYRRSDLMEFISEKLETA